MISNYRCLGDYIQQTDIRNEDLSVKKLLGVSIDKDFIESHANTVGVDFSNYKIVKRGQFAYGPVTSRNGDKISIAKLEECDECIISSSYTSFEISKPDELNADYLMILFRNPEFDRYARYNSWGSAREVFSWEELCSTEFKIPSIDEQKEIVMQYNIIQNRINVLKKMNYKLQSLAYSFYKELTFNAPKNAKLSDIAFITMGVSPNGDSINSKNEGIIFYQGKTDFGFRFPIVRQFTTQYTRLAKPNDILMSVRAPVGPVNIAINECAIGRGLAAIKPKDKRYSFLYYTMLSLNEDLKRYDDEGTVFGSITKDELYNLPIVNIDYFEKEKFENKISVIDSQIFKQEKEIKVLENLINLIFTKID